MPFGIVAYALMLFSWTTFLETTVNKKTTKQKQNRIETIRRLIKLQMYRSDQLNQ